MIMNHNKLFYPSKGQQTRPIGGNYRELFLKARLINVRREKSRQFYVKEAGQFELNNCAFTSDCDHDCFDGRKNSILERLGRNYLWTLDDTRRNSRWHHPRRSRYVGMDPTCTRQHWSRKACLKNIFSKMFQINFDPSLPEVTISLGGKAPLP